MVLSRQTRKHLFCFSGVAQPCEARFAMRADEVEHIEHEVFCPTGGANYGLWLNNRKKSIIANLPLYEYDTYIINISCYEQV